MGAEQQRVFQEALARLCVEASLRQRWRHEPETVCVELGLDRFDRARAVLGAVTADTLDELATRLFEQRWSLVARTVPATARVWPGLRDVCLAHAGDGDVEASVDGEAQARRSPGLRVLLRVRQPVHAELRKGEGAPPWLGDLFSFELERALAREEGASRELECVWPAHELASSCARGEVPPAPTPGAFHYRMVADRLFVRGD